jgi:hypothetical protein
MARPQVAAASLPIPNSPATPTGPHNSSAGIGSSSPSNRFNLSNFIPRRPRPNQAHARSPTEPSSPGTGPDSSTGGFSLRRSTGPGRSSRSRSASQPPPPSSSSSDLNRPQTAESTPGQQAGRSSADTASGGAARGNDGQPDTEHTVRLVPHLDLSSRSLSFEPLTRTITSSKPLRIGRFTERGGSSNDQGCLTSGCVAFKSKVVSRSHAVLSVDANGDFWVVDTKSSSGS